MTKSYYEELDINLIKLDIDNPRIKMYLENYENPTAEGIALALNSSSNDGQTSFSSLKESIRVNGGIINPIIVNHKGNNYIVIEGNTRLQIYKDFNSQNVSGDWNKIRAIVYENLTDEEIHSIRLQSHFCGGKKNEINRLVSAYRDMQQFYVPKVKEYGYDIDYKDFSKFAELQNRSIIDSLIFNHYTKEDFAKWVIEGNIDSAQNVRCIPSILKNKQAKEEFFKSNISNALTKLNVESSNLDLNNTDYIELSKILTNKLDTISYKEATFLKQPEGQDKKNILLTLRDSINFIIEEEE